MRENYNFSRAHVPRISRTKLLIAKRRSMRVARIGKLKLKANFLATMDKIRADRPRGLRSLAMRLSWWWRDHDWPFYRSKWWLQKRVRGWADCDVWNAGDRITELALLLLEKYIAIPPHGHPASYQPS